MTDAITGGIMTPRSLEEIVTSGARVSKRELFWALRKAGLDVRPTAKSTHFLVEVGAQLVLVAVRKDSVLPKYVSRLARALGLRGGGS
jgi:hypothetical protein